MCGFNHALIKDKTQFERGVCLLNSKHYTGTLRLSLPSFTLMCSQPTTFSYLSHVDLVGSFTVARSICQSGHFPTTSVDGAFK